MADGSYDVVESLKTKIVKVEKFNGIMSYWGHALDHNWDTLNWLRERASRAKDFPNPESFISSLSTDLRSAIGQKGIGIHFSAYEEVGADLIPELFIMSSWTNSNYTDLLAGPYRVTRETYAAFMGDRCQIERHGEPSFRQQVRKVLHELPFPKQLFNNGDPLLFNPTASAITHFLIELNERQWMKDPDLLEAHQEIARAPIQTISILLEKLSRPGKRLIGGDIHDLAINSDGEYHSTSVKVGV